MDLPKKPQSKSWAISVRCRSKGLDFRMNVVNVLPNWGHGGERISLFLRLKRFFLLNVESEYRDPTQNLDLKKKKKKSRLRRFWGSIGKLFGPWRIRRNRRVDLVKEKECSNFLTMRDESYHSYQTSLIPVIGSLALLFYSSTQRDHRGILIYTVSYIFYLVSFYKSTRHTQISSTCILILVGIAGLYFSYLTYGGVISKAIYMGSNWICSLAFIYLVLSKLISSRPSISIERRRMIWFLLIPFLLVLLYKLRMKILLYLVKIAFYGSHAWISGLLLTTQAMFQILFETKGRNFAFGALLSSAYFWGKEMANYLVPFLQFLHI